MNRKYLLSIGALAAVAVMGAGVASAHFNGPDDLSPEEQAQHQKQMFEHHAQMLGVSVEEYKESWAEGKTLSEIMEEHGIDKEGFRERMKQQRTQRLQEKMSALVEQGVISQEQADQRIAAMQGRMESGEKGPRGLRGPRGGGHGPR